MAMFVKNICNTKTFVFSSICLVFVVISLLGLLQRTHTLSHYNVLKTLRKLADVSSSNTCQNVTKQFESGCGVRNVSITNKKCCFYLSSSKHTLEQLAKMDAQMESRLNNCKGIELGTKLKSRKMLVNFGNISKLCKRFVTLDHYRGRMGNQMFQIASLIGTAYTHDVIPILPNSLLLKSYFTLPNMINLKLNKKISVVNCVCRKSAAFYNCTKEFNSKKNVSLHGYLQSWKYFEGTKDVIKTAFKFKTKHLLQAKTFLSNVSIAGFQRVCIHIRRGDITYKANVAGGYTVAGLDFIEKAKQFYINKYSRVQFLVVSNDKAWCRKHLKNVYISPFTDPGDDMALMTLSDHVIVTAGTFGWWGAWLSGGTTVYFNKHPRPGSSLASRIIKKDYYPPGWIGMS